MNDIEVGDLIIFKLSSSSYSDSKELHGSLGIITVKQESNSDIFNKFRVFSQNNQIEYIMYADEIEKA